MPEKDNINRFQELIDQAAGIYDPVERSRKYKTIVGMFSQQAVRSNDFSYIVQAEKVASMVTDDPSKAYVDIIRAIAKLKKKDRDIFGEATRMAEKIDNNIDLSVALCEIVSAFGKPGDELIFSESINLINKIPLATYSSLAYRNLSKSFADNQSRSLEFLNNAIDLIGKGEGIEPLYLIPAFCDTAVELARLRDAKSPVFLNKAIELANNVQDDFEKSAVLLKITETCLELYRSLKDKELLNEALFLSKGITKEYYKTLAKDALNYFVGNKI